MTKERVKSTDQGDKESQKLPPFELKSDIEVAKANMDVELAFLRARIIGLEEIHKAPEENNPERIKKITAAITAARLLIEGSKK